jgi:hypothetical protein
MANCSVTPPRRLPSASDESPPPAASAVVTISGMEVAVARKMKPIIARPMRIRSAISSA